MDPVRGLPSAAIKTTLGNDATTRSGHDASQHALHVVEYALSAPAPRRERTWLHRLTIAIDALSDAID